MILIYKLGKGCSLNLRLLIRVFLSLEQLLCHKWNALEFNSRAIYNSRIAYVPRASYLASNTKWEGGIVNKKGEMLGIPLCRAWASTHMFTSQCMCVGEPNLYKYSYHPPAITYNIMIRMTNRKVIQQLSDSSGIHSNL